MSDDLGFNKIAGAILATALGFIGINHLSHALYHPHSPETLAYGAESLAAWEAAQGTEAGPVIELPFPQADWVNAMNAAAGEKLAAKCAACHTFDKGGAAKTGPNLWNIVGAQSASAEGYSNYSNGMRDMNIVWDYENLDSYLEKPARFVKGTAMAFGGFKKPEQRAAMIEYLRVQADAPLDRPVAAPAAPEEEAGEMAMETEMEKPEMEDGAAPSEMTAPAETAAEEMVDDAQ